HCRTSGPIMAELRSYGLCPVITMRGERHAVREAVFTGLQIEAHRVADHELQRSVVETVRDLAVEIGVADREAEAALRKRHGVVRVGVRDAVEPLHEVAGVPAGMELELD